MPTVQVVLPDRDKTKLQAQAVELLTAAGVLGLELDMDGCIKAWLSDSTRAVLAKEGDTVVGFAMMGFGRRWFDPEPSATVFLLAGPARAQVLEYLRDLAAVLGAHKFMWTWQAGDPFGGVNAQVRTLEV